MQDTASGDDVLQLDNSLTASGGDVRDVNLSQNTDNSLVDLFEDTGKVYTTMKYYHPSGHVHEEHSSALSLTTGE